MKKNEWKLKATIYGFILGVIDKQSNIVNLFQNLYVALKDTPVNELKSELIVKIAELAHQQAMQENEADDKVM